VEGARQGPAFEDAVPEKTLKECAGSIRVYSSAKASARNWIARGLGRACARDRVGDGAFCAWRATFPRCWRIPGKFASWADGMCGLGLKRDGVRGDGSGWEKPVDRPAHQVPRNPIMGKKGGTRISCRRISSEPRASERTDAGAISKDYRQVFLDEMADYRKGFRGICECGIVA